MKARVLVIVCGSVILHLLLAGAVQAQVLAEASEATSKTLALPDLAGLRGKIVARKLSTIKRDLRVRLFTQLETMTTNHTRLYQNARLPWVIEPDAAKWAAGRVESRMIPSPDRAIIAGILLQIDLLDGVLATRDPRGAEALREGRKKHPVHSQSEGVFGDRRDLFLYFCRDEFTEIARLQAAIDKSLGSWEPGALAKSSVEAETCLIEGCTRLAERSRQIQ